MKTKNSILARGKSEGMNSLFRFLHPPLSPFSPVSLFPLYLASVLRGANIFRVGSLTLNMLRLELEFIRCQSKTMIIVHVASLYFCLATTTCEEEEDMTQEIPPCSMETLKRGNKYNHRPHLPSNNARRAYHTQTPQACPLLILRNVYLFVIVPQHLPLTSLPSSDIHTCHLRSLLNIKYIFRHIYSLYSI